MSINCVTNEHIQKHELNHRIKISESIPIGPAVTQIMKHINISKIVDDNSNPIWSQTAEEMRQKDSPTMRIWAPMDENPVVLHRTEEPPNQPNSRSDRTTGG